MVVLGKLEEFAAIAVVADADLRLVGAAALAGLTGSSATASIDLHAVPGEEAHVRRVAPDIVRAAFEGSGIRHLYHERFDDDPDMLTEMAEVWRLEATLPEFAMVDGRYADRLILGISADELTAWWAATARSRPAPEPR